MEYLNYGLRDITFHEDDRAQRLFDIFDNLDGQINISHSTSTEHIVAWHGHKIQTDYMFCVKGAFKVGLAHNGEVNWVYLSDKNHRVLEIPPPIFHGYKAIQRDSIMLYYLTRKYDEGDIYYLPVGHFGEKWEVENR